MGAGGYYILVIFQSILGKRVIAKLGKGYDNY